MNYSTAVFLINKNLRAVLAAYDPADYDKNKKTMFKTLDPTIKKDDLVVVPTGTRYGFTVVKVTDVDINVDLDDTTKIDWVVAKVDRAAYDTTLAQESEAIEKMKKAEFNKRRAALYDAMVSDADKDAIKALPIYANGSPQQPQPAPQQPAPQQPAPQQPAPQQPPAPAQPEGFGRPPNATS